MPYLAFNLNDGNEFVFDLLDERLSIGRDSKNDIVIDNSFISGFHAEFLKQPDSAYEVVDLKSSNGTFLNGKRVERSRLKGGDRVQFGQLEDEDLPQVELVLCYRKSNDNPALARLVECLQKDRIE